MTTTAVAAVFAGVAPAVLAIVAQAVIRVGRRALGRARWSASRWRPSWRWSCFAIPFPVVVLVAALAGWRASDGTGRDR